MKKIAVVLILICASMQANAQLFTKEKIRNRENVDKKRWSWGYYLGFNNYGFKIDYIDQNEIDVTRNIGFNVGLVGNLRINEYIDIRLEPGVVFANRNLEFPNLTETFEREREVKSSYVHIPLLIKFSSKRINNFKPFLVGGASVSHNLSSNENNPNDNSAGEFRMKTNVANLEVGFGIDFYFEYFKFTPSIRGIFAITDELVQDNDLNSPWTSEIDSMKSRGLFINFTFQ
ncbi:MAG: porin family protein [Psychroflexus halocasei]